MNKTIYVAVDFDGTIVRNEWPGIGALVPGVKTWLKQAVLLNTKIILWTARHGKELAIAEQYCKVEHLPIWKYNENPDSPYEDVSKVHCNILIDDLALGTALIHPWGGAPYVNWDIVGHDLLQRIKDLQA